MKTFDKIWITAAGAVAIGSLMVLGNILENTKPSRPQAEEVDTMKEQCDSLLLKHRDPIFTELRVLGTWWKDHQKVYAYEITEKDGDQINRLCVVDPSKGILFSPSIFNQASYLK